ncbi:MAG: DEAD/DEAH box helicase family protein, partial [Dehalococcoidia bacterium]|nr:DEAD/DEAH box helicase family protein [Dehalococcoidia bacterium]
LAALLTALADAHSEQGGAVLGVDQDEIQERLPRPRNLGNPADVHRSDPDEVERLLSADGPFASRFPGFEPRPEQVEMARAVAKALATDEQDAPHHLIVEGGTGIGKTVAYLLPIVLFAVRNNARVVVSTNTINLQEQLIGKDLPEIAGALRGVSGFDISRFRYAQMKGKANYLCLRGCR